MKPLVNQLTNPLAQTLVAKLRDQTTPPNEFRQTAQQLTEFVIYEASSNLPTTTVAVTTPITETNETVLQEQSPAIVGIWRAGQIMVDASLNVYPKASVGYLGMYRDEETHEPEFYYEKLPELIDRRVFLVDPMLATGGSLLTAIDKLNDAGANPDEITVACLLASTDGISNVHAKYKNVEIYAGAIDSELNEKAYIVPGLGDAGDRLYNT